MDPIKTLKYNKKLNKIEWIFNTENGCCMRRQTLQYTSVPFIQWPKNSRDFPGLSINFCIIGHFHSSC